MRVRESVYVCVCLIMCALCFVAGKGTHQHNTEGTSAVKDTSAVKGTSAVKDTSAVKGTSAVGN